MFKLRNRRCEHERERLRDFALRPRRTPASIRMPNYLKWTTTQVINMIYVSVFDSQTTPLGGQNLPKPASVLGAADLGRFAYLYPYVTFATLLSE